MSGLKRPGNRLFIHPWFSPNPKGFYQKKLEFLAYFAKKGKFYQKKLRIFGIFRQKGGGVSANLKNPYQKNLGYPLNVKVMYKITLLQVGESEAIYKLLAHMKMTYSSIATIFVPTEPKAQRRQFLQRQDPESGQGFEIEDKKGRFLEKPDLIDKYERRMLLPRREEEEETPQAKEEAETLEQMSFCQFVKMYEGKGWQEMRKTNEEGETEEPDDDDDEEKPEEGELAKEDGYHYLIVGNSEARPKKLPQLLTLADVKPGEPRILHKRTFPRAMRFFKKKYDRDPHLYYFTELILFHPFRDENELFPYDPEKCEELYMSHQDEIKYVKAKLMPFLESVEEAQLIYEEMKADERREKEEAMGADLDPEMEQEIADLDDFEEEEHPDFYHLDPGQLDDNPVGETRPSMVFKAVALPSKDAQVTDIKICMEMFNVFNFRLKRQGTWTQGRRRCSPWLSTMPRGSSPSHWPPRMSSSPGPLHL